MNEDVAEMVKRLRRGVQLSTDVWSPNPTMNAAADLLESLSSKPGAWAEQAAEEIYKPRPFCRDCADHDGVCPHSREPCKPVVRAAAIISRHSPASYDDGWKAGILAAVKIIEDHRRDAPETIAAIGLKQTLIAAIRALLASAGGEGK